MQIYTIYKIFDAIIPCVLCKCSVVAVNGGEKELLQTEGIVILHISFALKQGQELRQEYFKSLEVRQWFIYW